MRLVTALVLAAALAPAGGCADSNPYRGVPSPERVVIATDKNDARRLPAEKAMRLFSEYCLDRARERGYIAGYRVDDDTNGLWIDSNGSGSYERGEPQIPQTGASAPFYVVITLINGREVVAPMYRDTIGVWRAAGFETTPKAAADYVQGNDPESALYAFARDIQTARGMEVVGTSGK